MEDMSGMWENFQLNDREEVPFEFGPEEEIEQFYLAARFMTSRVLNIESVVRTFKPLWRAAHGFTARDMGNNMLVFAFEDVSDLERVLQSEPWSYDKHLVSFQRVEADTSISEMDCQWVSFWVQIHNLPVRRMNHETASALGGTLGVVEKVVESEEERGRKETWISFKYERLPNFCYWCGLLTHGDRDCEKWLRSKGTLRREDQQYGAWLRASVERPIRRVEVKVIGRSDVPRWGKSHQKNEDHGGQNSTHGGNGSPKVVKSFMDFTQLKENLPNPFGDDSATAVNAEQILPTNPAASILSTDPSTAVNVEQILSTNSAASMQYSDPNTAVNVEKTLPKKSTASIPSFDPSIAANHVEKDVHSCAKSPPNDSATAVNVEQILPTNPAASILSTDPSTAVNVEQILSTNSAASMQYSDQNTAYSDQNTAVNVEKTLPKTSTASIPSFDPSIAANRVEKDVHSCAKSPPDFLQQNAVHSCVKSSPHFPQKNDVGKKGDKINPSGILRDISGSIRKGKESQLRKKKSMGVKRSGALSDGDSNYSGWQKKVRGNEGNQSTTLDGDEAEAVAVLVLHNLVKSEGPTVLFLMETKLDVRGMESIRVKLGFKFCFSVPCLGRSGGLALLWNDPAQVTIQNFSQNHVDSHVQLAEGAKWRFTGFYGHPEGHRKWESWVLLDKLHSLDNTPWLCMGDFNEILSISERSGEVLGSTRRMQDFSDVVNRCGLVDLGFRGIPFTWENRRDGEALIQKRLDRALANAAWLDCFNLCSVSHVVCSYSDHVPLLLHMDTSTRHCQPKRRPRKFEEKWSLHPECEAIIQDVWSREEAIGSPMFILCEKIKHCREALYRWYKDVSGEFQNKIKVHTASLTSLISSNFAGQNNSAIASLKAEINKLLLSEELHWRQRSRMTWLAAGDSNTKFFHSQANQRRRTNCLSGLWNSDNVWCTDESQIENIAVSYFDDIFHTSTPVNLEDTLTAVNSRVTPEANQRLLQPFTADEVRIALFQMHPSKAPGPDGMSSFFFQKYWNIVGVDVVAAVLSVLNSGKILRKINLTHISLIPKKKNPERMSEYRPISLCNVVYKIISKVLANRLKVILPCIISDSQSAFVPGRLITDNVSVAFEFIHKMKAKRRGKKGEMAIKLDMSKAYDRVEWAFIEGIMRKLGFAERWISLLMECICTVQYSVLIDGVPKGYINPTRGIRQGDPLSPYVFLLCAEGLSALFQQASAMGHLKGIQSCRGGPWVSHLFFADDSLLFGQANISECRKILEILNLYEGSSGQKINREKTAIYFSSNTSQVTRQLILEFWGSQGASIFDKYLGLPAMIGRSKKSIFNGLKERIVQRLQGWKEKFLSKAGREVLIKAVAQAIPTYAMNCFRLPKAWCEEVNGLIARYWWGQKKDERKLHWIKWDKLCTAKAEGGLGFRNLHSFNTALLAKQCWRLIHNTQSLFYRVFKARYFPSCSFTEAQMGSNPSFLWRSILSGRGVLNKGLRWHHEEGQLSRPLWSETKTGVFSVKSAYEMKNQTFPLESIPRDSPHKPSTS
uniref:Reverse transcriptase domain-containing protein n=1 Tax=Fagus sylvatica TaxID=28930 RepID=A0A2N9HU09_FAGSY